MFTSFCCRRTVGTKFVLSIKRDDGVCEQIKYVMLYRGCDRTMWQPGTAMYAI